MSYDVVIRRRVDVAVRRLCASARRPYDVTIRRHIDVKIRRRIYVATGRLYVTSNRDVYTTSDNVVRWRLYDDITIDVALDVACGRLLDVFGSQQKESPHDVPKRRQSAVHVTSPWRGDDVEFLGG